MIRRPRRTQPAMWLPPRRVSVILLLQIPSFYFFFVFCDDDDDDGDDGDDGDDMGNSSESQAAGASLQTLLCG